AASPEDPGLLLAVARLHVDAATRARQGLFERERGGAEVPPAERTPIEMAALDHLVKARPLLERAVKISPASLDTWVALRTVLEQLGDLEALEAVQTELDARMGR
ncbi:MAG: hypothetical protein KC656_31560, partial [Myxococcales bacterium]|nr:hypothetical protein [Myxococcales bacterium]